MGHHKSRFRGHKQARSPYQHTCPRQHPSSPSSSLSSSSSSLSSSSPMPASSRPPPSPATHRTAHSRCAQSHVCAASSHHPWQHATRHPLSPARPPSRCPTIRRALRNVDHRARRAVIHPRKFVARARPLLHPRSYTPGAAPPASLDSKRQTSLIHRSPSTRSRLAARLAFSRDAQAIG
ncbi:hypothetical protein DAEQUDRAFT_313977 [Daedalea quercina L-15889]|uniref:Uncharacterized protein n=1 Tax=Daedalea quercina L-15889 TaxID=1314783 RepID=A0A165PV54_9APHY|nr:hypothetical protein DAEQUDRAFT_313977 [Daedalea quercina L-15889]